MVVNKSLPITPVAGGRYIAAVSGGIDSMVLLDSLCKLPHLEIIVAHFDHGIRSDSAADAQFVATAAKARGLPFVMERKELGEAASEQQARTARYDFLRSAMVEYHAAGILLAHHQDDVLETAVINVLRGTGWRGLASLRSTAEMIRPLLSATKRQIREYAAEHAITWREDSTNSDYRYLRNRVRLEYLPLLQRRSPEAFAILLAYIQEQIVLREEIELLVAELLPTENNGQICFARTRLIMLPNLVGRELLRAAATQLTGAAVEQATLRRMLHFAKTAKPAKRFEATKKVGMRIEGQSVIVSRR